MTLIDSHCHLTFDDLATQIDAVLERATAADVTHLVNICTNVDDARRALDMLIETPQVSFAFGLHPHDATRAKDELPRLAALVDEVRADDALRKRLVAIGETGLDFHYDFSPRGQQELAFAAHLDLAKRLDLPVIIHGRNAEARCGDMLIEHGGFEGRAVFHCYTGTLADARRLLDAGFLISFTGIVTFKKSTDVQEVARYVPDDRLMVETDAPYLSPQPVRGKRPCEPAYVAHTAAFLAQLRNTTPDALAAATTRTAINFYGLPELTPNA